MRPCPVLRVFLIAMCMLLTAACTGTELTRKETKTGPDPKPVSNVLVIVIADKDATRRSFENRFVAELKAAGVDAVSSETAVSMPPDLKLEKSAILDAVNRYGSDTVLVTHLVGIDEKEIYTRMNSAPPGYYGYYDSIYRYMHEPGDYRTRATVRLETNVYDVESENRIWSGETRTWNASSEEDVFDDVVRVAVQDMEKSGLFGPGQE